MNTYRTTVSWLIAGSLLLIGMVGIASVSVGQDPNPPFVETEYQGLEDMKTGLVWGKDINRNTGLLAAEAYVNTFYYVYGEDPETREPIPPPGLEFAGPIDPDTGERIPCTDWRPPTVGEVHEAITNGLLTYFDFSYCDGNQGLGDVMDMYMPEDPNEQPAPGALTYGEVYFWTTCIDRWKSFSQRYKIRFSDADVIFGSGAGWVLAVRGAPENHDNCPGKHGGADDHGKPDKPGKPPK